MKAFPQKVRRITTRKRQGTDLEVSADPLTSPLCYLYGPLRVFGEEQPSSVATKKYSREGRLKLNRIESLSLSKYFFDKPLRTSHVPFSGKHDDPNLGIL